MLLALLLLFMMLFFLVAGIFFLKMNEDNLSRWEKLPRNRTAGGILGLIALLAFIPNVKPLFSPEQNLYWLIPAALILAALCYLYLDHLLARSAAGALILREAGGVCTQADGRPLPFDGSKPSVVAGNPRAWKELAALLNK